MLVVVVYCRCVLCVLLWYIVLGCWCVGFGSLLVLFLVVSRVWPFVVPCCWLVVVVRCSFVDVVYCLSLLFVVVCCCLLMVCVGCCL